MKILFFSSIVFTILGFKNPAQNLDISHAKMLSETDSIDKNVTNWLRLECGVNPEKVHQFTVTKKKKDYILEQFNIVKQEVSYYCQGAGTHRKMYNNTFRQGIKLPTKMTTRNLEAIYFIDNEQRKTGL